MSPLAPNKPTTADPEYYNMMKHNKKTLKQLFVYFLTVIEELIKSFK